nr:hypothetical protein [Tanacetum cinerariifolium]
VKVLRVPVGYETDALASFWRYSAEVLVLHCSSTVEYGFPQGLLLLQVSFAPFVLFFLSYLPSFHPVLMSSGSRFVEEPIISKFYMHTFTSSMTADEVSALAEEYVIPSDIRPRVFPPILTMNKLPVGAIGIYEQY